jgi:hypothetical protein
MIKFQDSKYFQLNKVHQEYVKRTVAGVGDEGFCGPAPDPQYILFFRKKSFCVSVSTYLNITGKTPTMLTMDQLIAVGKLIASRI